ncbi:MAG TPA: hypothetical protein PK771_03800 [Spirochaetota bacterium]|nr:hypothetical protein [Spirochaetota bacterium]
MRKILRICNISISFYLWKLPTFPKNSGLKPIVSRKKIENLIYQQISDLFYDFKNKYLKLKNDFTDNKENAIIEN